MKKFLYALLLCVFAVGGLSANNIRIIGIPVLREDDKDTVKNTVKIRFDIAWDNSWRSSKPNNHDAAWIFVKCWDGEAWNHVYLEEDGYQAGSKNITEAANVGKVTYYVSNREGTKTQMDMKLEAGYSMAWKLWKLDPTEKAQKCVVGYFLYRDDFGAGDVVVPGVYFTWNYGNQGFVDEDDLVVKVFAVEMVYVPKGSYYLGGRGTAAWQVGSFTTDENTFGRPMVVTKEDAIKVENSTSEETLWAANDAITAGTIPATFPKGVNAFYIMKYEMTQEAYCEFLNTLNQGQQQGRVQGNLSALGVGAFAWGGDVSPMRNHVRIKQAAPVVIFGMDANNNGKFNETDSIVYRINKPGSYNDTLVRNIDGQDVAMNLVSVYDLLAYAEFAGLRPMTELEYEKACRGPREPVNDEYAWGSVTKVFFGKSFHINAGNYYHWYEDAFRDINTGTEHIPAEWGYNYGVSIGHTQSGWWGGWDWRYPAPFRVGIFADSTTTRPAAGATFWGVMNMSDNVVEVCISAVDTVGRKFVGTHGSGKLSPNGDAINPDWHVPGLTGPEEADENGDTKYHYYITRGYAVHETAIGKGCDGGVYYWTDWVIRGWGIDWDGDYAGMVSSRRRWNQSTQELSQRQYWEIDGAGGGNWIDVNFPCMLGIRCVRTENADK